MKISARDIQLFVAWAFSLTGFFALFWLFYYLFYVRDGVAVFSHLIAGLALPLGIGILIGRPRALLWTEAYLWVAVILGLICIPIYCYIVPAKAWHVVWKETPDMLTSIAFLGLIIWSRSRRFRHEPDA